MPLDFITIGLNSYMCSAMVRDEVQFWYLKPLSNTCRTFLPVSKVESVDFSVHTKGFRFIFSTLVSVGIRLYFV